MTWHTPITWQIDQLVTETDLNDQIRDNLTYLKDRVDTPATGLYTANETSDYSTSSTSFVDVDSTNFAFTLTTKGNAVVVSFTGVVYISSAGENRCYLDILVDGGRKAGDDGYAIVTGNGSSGASGNTSTVSFSILMPTLTAGNHTFKLQWKVGTGGTAILRAGAGSANFDLHPHLWVREIS